MVTLNGELLGTENEQICTREYFRQWLSVAVMGLFNKFIVSFTPVGSYCHKSSIFSKKSREERKNIKVILFVNLQKN